MSRFRSLFVVGALSALVASLGGPASAGPASAPNFVGETHYAVGEKPYSVTAADFNGDGAPDLVVPNQDSDDVSVMLGRGDGTFEPGTRHTAGDGPRTVATDDFDGDGKTDLAVANKESDDVSILLGTGTGGFGAPVNFGVGDGPRTVTTGDFDKDGVKDLVIVNRFSDGVSVLLGRPGGTFAAAVDYPTGDRAYDVVVADFNGDAREDLAVANTTDDDVSILLGRGDGTFGPARDLAVGDSPFAVAAADLNGDGRTDLAVGNLLGRNVQVLLGRGDGTFGAPRAFGTGTYAFALATADLDGDGALDVAVANHPYRVNTYPGSVSVMRGNGDGTLGAPEEWGTAAGPVAVTAADLDGDGKPDLAVTNQRSNNVSVLPQGTTRLTTASSATTLTYPQTTALTGRLTAPDGTPLGGRKIILEARPWIFDDWTPVAGQPADGLTTAPDGTFRLAGVVPRWTTDYRARFAGEPGGPGPVTSAFDVTEVKVRVSLNVSGTTMRVGQGRTISGTVAPEHKDMSVRLIIERNGRPFATREVPLVDSRFRTTYRPPEPGSYAVVARFPDHPPGHLGNDSPRRTFKVVG